MKENLKMTFAKDLEALVIPWNKSPQCDSEKAQDYYWLPILDLSEGRAKVGITPEGVWGIAKDGCIRILSDERSYVFLLPILEKSPQAAFSLIAEGFINIGLSREYLDLFPFEGVILAALKSNSEYWSSMGLQWVGLFVRTPELQVSLEVLSREGATQEVRHRARKLARYR